MNHTALWASPAPLWGRFDGLGDYRHPSQAAPALLRFDSDDFMQQALATLAADPRQLSAFIARPETWRTPMDAAPDLVEHLPLPSLARALGRRRTAGAASSAIVAPSPAVAEQGVARTLPLKLYHPAHQRHYLVGAQLVCGLPGFPDRAVAGGGREQVGFVLRRLLPRDRNNDASDRVEFAFVKDSTGARWQRVVAEGSSADAATQVAGEELLPLFPMNFQDAAGHPRRLLAGTVPVGRREEYMGSRAEHAVAAPGAVLAAGVAASPSDIAARKEQFKMEVSEPWKGLLRSAVQAAARIEDASFNAVKASTQPQRDQSATTFNQQAQGQSWLTLLDFADYLLVHLPEVWRAVTGQVSNAALPRAAQRALHSWLSSAGTAPGALPIGLSGSQPASLAAALAAVRASDSVRQGLEQATVSYPDANDTAFGWPAFAYPLAALRASAGHYAAFGPYTSLGALPVAPDPADADPAPPSTPPLMLFAEQQAALLDKLVQLVVSAIDTTRPAAPAPPLPFAVRLRDALATTAGDEGWFTIRCVYQRCDCGPLQPVVLSVPSERFQLASFFDADAPARPIRITLPTDTTPAGLRKHSKNTAFMISDVLCGQIQRAKGLGLVDLVLSVLPWPFHKDLNLAGTAKCKSNGIDIGMICSLSIPIVTICALILLIIIVSLFDFIFRWLPWFVMCFPVPKGLKGKK